jgi:serine/threonine-protein kinase
MLVGRELGPYVVEKELGSGAMGTVFRARHKKNGEKVAVKVLSPAIVGNEAALARFTRECAILKQLDHPNIVKYFGSGRVHGTPFYIMEYVDGESLDRVMARRDRMTWEEVVELGAPLCGALQHAHDKGIIHRDLKPSNVMILRDGTVKLTDFGIAKDCDVTALTAQNSTVGTAAYMSPEQCRGTRDLTFKSDLYSLGVMFFELITGRKPFLAESTIEMFHKHADEQAPRPTRFVLELPVWMDNLICQLMEKKPDQRPFSAERVGQALQEVKQKVEAQVSAGVDTAKKRRVDRNTRDIPLDETDRDAARALLGKKKKKKKAPAFYQKGWFTIASLALVALGLVGVLYLIFFKAPDAEGLFQQAQKVAKSGSLQDKRAARKDGPISEFLYYHPSHPKAKQVQEWADQIDTEDMENAFLNRLSSPLKVELPEKEKRADEEARTAVRYENEGLMDDALKAWRDLARFKKENDPDLRSWGLLGEKRASDLKAVDSLYEDLKLKITSENLTNKKAEAEDADERFALDAVRAERKKDWTVARESWEQAKKLTKESPQKRPLHLLAARNLVYAEANEKKK